MFGYKRLGIMRYVVISPNRIAFRWSKGWNDCKWPYSREARWPPPPTFHNEIGLYAYSDYMQAFRYRTGMSSLDTIVVRVEGAGVVVEHEVGFRAEYMRVVEVDDWRLDTNSKFVAQYFDAPLVDMYPTENRGPRYEHIFWKD